MDIIGSKMVLGTLNVGSPSPVLVVPDASATARFSEIMQSDPVAVTVSLPQTGSVPSAQAPATLGDRILEGLNGLSTDFQQSWKNVSAVLDGGQSMTTADMLKFQMNLTQMSIQYDLVGKAISRSTQNVEQLVKIQ